MATKSVYIINVSKNFFLNYPIAAKNVAAIWLFILIVFTEYKLNCIKIALGIRFTRA